MEDNILSPNAEIIEAVRRYVTSSIGKNAKKRSYIRMAMTEFCAVNRIQLPDELQSLIERLDDESLPEHAAGRRATLASPEGERRIVKLDKSKPLIPLELRPYLDRAVEEGLLDRHYQRCEGLSRSRSAILAALICRAAGKRNCWSVFERLWGINHLSSDYQKGLGAHGEMEFIEKVSAMFEREKEEG